MPTLRKIWIGFGVTLLVALPIACGTSVRSGLFNTRTDQREALAEQQAAWDQRRLPRRISRHQMLMLMREFDGRCITGEADWETVPLDRRLDDFFLPQPTR